MSSLTNKGLRLFAVGSSLTKIRGYPVRYIITNLQPFGVKWVKPEKVKGYSAKKSGDGGLNLGIKPTDIPKIYAESPEFKDIDDKLKPLFSMAFLTQHDLGRYKLERTKDLVRRHRCDASSYEVIIASMTAVILKLQKHVENNPRNVFATRFLKEIIEKRQKYLTHLRNWDYRRFEWLLEKLNLVYHPIPTDKSPPYRKEAIRKLVQKKCDSIVQEKLASYRAALNAEKKQFFKEKAEKLEFIRNEEIACGVTPTVTEEEIEEVRKVAKELEK